MQFKGWCGMEINSKEFAIPILTAILSTIDQIQLANCFKIYFHSIATLELYLQPVSILFDPKLVYSLSLVVKKRLKA